MFERFFYFIGNGQPKIKTNKKNSSLWYGTY